MTKITLHTDERFQTFERFGVSGAWWAQVVGRWTEPDEESGLPKRERIAQLLFDKENGIGVRCYRYNLGGGSAASGKGDFGNASRRAESFDTDGGYDWDRDANAVWVLQKAVQFGADEVIFFVNSPPERLTKNGMAHCSKPFHTNLARENYASFAAYCLDCVEHFRALGVPIRYLSPVNEPLWKWTGGQEGCHYRPRQVKRLLRVFADALDERPALAGLRLSAAENGDIRFYNKTYTRIVLGDKKIRKAVDAVDLHSYFVKPGIPLPACFVDDRTPFLRRYRRWLDRRFPGVPVKTSEWTHMQGGRDYGMDSALEQTKVMLEDLTILNVSAWQLWIAVSNVDYCDGLIYTNDDARTFELTKRYYAFGQFSKFIEPDSVRFLVDAGDDLQGAGFTKNGLHVVVIANHNAYDVQATLPEQIREIYVTSEACSLTPFAPARDFTFPQKSVTTLIFEEGRASDD